MTCWDELLFGFGLLSVVARGINALQRNGVSQTEKQCDIIYEMLLNGKDHLLREVILETWKVYITP